MIPDAELRNLFQEESSEHLQCLEQGLLRLEVNPRDAQTLDLVFRAAHSLKGAACMMELPKVEAIAHRFEDLLGASRRGATVLTQNLIDRLYHALDSIRALCLEATTGKTAEADIGAVLGQLTAENDSPADKASRAPTEDRPPAQQDPRPLPPADAAPSHAAPSHAEPQDLMPPAGGRPPTAPPARPLANVAPFSSPSLADSPSKPTSAEAEPLTPADYTIDTVRVPSEKLDLLLRQAGELSVTRGRIGRRAAQIDQLVTMWEEWSRDASAVRRFLNRTEAETDPLSARQAREYLQHDRQRRERFGALLKELSAAAKSDDARIEVLASQLEDGVRAVRLLPLSSVFSLYPRMVRDLARNQSKEIQFHIDGGDTTADKRIVEEVKDPLTHLLRNAVDHGVESPQQRLACGKPAEALLVLRAFPQPGRIVVEVSDDGRGIDLEAVKRSAIQRQLYSEREMRVMTAAQLRQLIFSPGFSTKSQVSDVSGRGVGLDVVRTNVERLRGRIEVDSEQGRGTVFRLIFPISLSTHRVLLALAGGRRYAIPVDSVQTTRLLAPEEVFPLESRPTILQDGQPLSVAHLADLLQTPPPAAPHATGDAAQPRKACIVLLVDKQRFGVVVDQLLDEQEIIVKPHGAMLRRVRNVSGSTILQTGEVCIVLNPQDLCKTLLMFTGRSSLTRLSPPAPPQKSILLVEDSAIVRTRLRRILEADGYAVVVASNGVEALAKLDSQPFSAIVTDVEMPEMDGLELAERVRQHETHGSLPLLVVTTLASAELHRRGLSANVSAYLTKPSFDQEVFLETLRKLTQ